MSKDPTTFKEALDWLCARGRHDLAALVNSGATVFRCGDREFRRSAPNGVAIVTKAQPTAPTTKSSTPTPAPKPAAPKPVSLAAAKKKRNPNADVLGAIRAAHATDDDGPKAA
jgi:hypothetical protein